MIIISKDGNENMRAKKKKFIHIRAFSQKQIEIVRIYLKWKIEIEHFRTFV